MKIHRNFVYLPLVVCFLASAARANNLVITNVVVLGIDHATAHVQFDISWDNSWNKPDFSHDAAWVFFKVQQEGNAAWQHAKLEGTGVNPAGFSVGSGTPIEIEVAEDRLGMFVRRSGQGEGDLAVQKVKAVWNIASNGLTKADSVTMKAFGVEMVYVPQGSFKVGSGGTGSGELFEGGVSNAFLIASAGPIPCSNEVGCLWGYSQAGNNSMGGNGWIPAAFPNGYNAFYCMKYEITQGQYVDFFNMLTAAQKTARDIGVRYSYQRSMVLVVDGVASTIRPDRAANSLSALDVCAWADWSGLRPMTELEYEKACRGPAEPVPNEYAWGTTTIRPSGNVSLVVAGIEDGTERLASNTSLGGAYCYNNRLSNGAPPEGGQPGPLRVGIFATNDASRVTGGASYWGIMELSGNLRERPVITIGTADGRAFTGLHGDGVLTSDGKANVANWPGSNGTGSGNRGGSWYDAATGVRVSDRTEAAKNSDNRDGPWGGRAVRSATAGLNTAYGGAAPTVWSGGSYDGWGSAGMVAYTSLRPVVQTIIVIW